MPGWPDIWPYLGPSGGTIGPFHLVLPCLKISRPYISTTQSEAHPNVPLLLWIGLPSPSCHSLCTEGVLHGEASQRISMAAVVAPSTLLSQTSGCTGHCEDSCPALAPNPHDEEEREPPPGSESNGAAASLSYCCLNVTPASLASRCGMRSCQHCV
jgi:hypothetical protein